MNPKLETIIIFREPSYARRRILFHMFETGSGSDSGDKDQHSSPESATDAPPKSHQ
jgi:hypothetical protein